MKHSIDLVYKTPPEWAQFVLTDLDGFLQNHADAERKASAMAMHFIAKAPDKLKFIPHLIEVAQEELEHFAEVYKIMEKRGILLPHKIPGSKYIQTLMTLCRHGKEERLLDRMILASIIEVRAAEKLRLISEALEDPELKKFYKMLWTSEAKHGDLYVKLALYYWDKELVYERLDELNKAEGEIISSLDWVIGIHP
ncbi:MAG: tRNA-(ms[2]io[6]A)-hydroxylase [Patiriisocius sp.]|jgi:tRNA-(ms[2]io[6]A)-hydroxylase